MWHTDDILASWCLTKYISCIICTTTHVLFTSLCPSANAMDTAVHHCKDIFTMLQRKIPLRQFCSPANSDALFSWTKGQRRTKDNHMWIQAQIFTLLPNPNWVTMGNTQTVPPILHPSNLDLQKILGCFAVVGRTAHEQEEAVRSNFHAFEDRMIPLLWSVVLVSGSNPVALTELRFVAM